jgi:hypothetical protein
MYGHNVISDFEKTFKNIKQFSSSLHSEEEIKAMKELKKGIKSSQHFNLGLEEDIKQYSINDIGEDIFRGNNAKDINLPYDTIWVDFEHMIGVEKIQEGMLINKIDNNLFEILTAYNIANIEELNGGNTPSLSKRWVLGKFRFLISMKDFSEKEKEYFKNKLLKHVGYQEFEKIIDRHIMKNIICWPIDNPIDHILNFNKLERKFGMDISDSLLSNHYWENWETSLYCIKIINTFLKVLNCKNVFTEKIERRKKIVKKGKVKTTKDYKKFDYKILVVKLSKRKKYITEEGREEGGNTRLHLCRGHFKEFYEKPLFGKIFGRWWWQPQIRGNKEKGFIGKEYKIKT